MRRRLCPGSGEMAWQRWRAATALGLILLAVAGMPGKPLAQSLAQPGRGAATEQLLLESDELIFNEDDDTVTALGSVRIDYDGSRLVADRVTYDRRSGRLIAVGNVEIVDRDGTRIYSDQIDVTDDFRDGFVNALRVETTEETYFGAESAERTGGRVTTFNQGVYTACKPCEKRPGRPPIWRVKGQTIIWNSEKKTIRFRNASFEFFGLPIAWLPYLEVPDHTVERKTGFLFPGIKYKSELGAGLTVPFYVALAPTYDLTLKATGYTRQGFLGEAEWRQRFNSGHYNLKVAGIHQQQPDAFKPGTVDRGTDVDPNRTRLMFATKGDFRINPRWAFGWDILVQNDKNFAYTYQIENYSDYVHRSEIYLTGLNDRNYFDLRAMRFQIQESIPDRTPAGLRNSDALNPLQPWVLPTFDYTYTPDAPVAGGELTFEVNSRVIYRNERDTRVLSAAELAAFNPARLGPAPAVRGTDDTNGRITSAVEWKRRFLAPGGLVLTPILHAQADATFTDYSSAAIADINAMAGALGVAADVRSSYYRYMATAGLEARWPILFSTTSAAHVLEPVAQIFVRPDEPYARSLGLPNEDAQSLVFDATTLFERDKFSGWDRIEGGTRANLGIRYSGRFANGWTANALFGQSYHLAGVNSFASPDLVSAGAFSGLETARSDYVGLVGVSTPFGVSAAAAGRFDEVNLEMRRGELRASYSNPFLSLSGQYAFIQAQPLYGFVSDRHEVSVGASTNLTPNWSLFASGTYDLEANLLVRDSLGISYADECVIYTMSMSQSRNRTTQEVTRSIGFFLSLRTIGDFGSSSSQFQQ